jgi:hypothetical protein
VGVRRAAQGRLRQQMEVVEAEFCYATLGLAVPCEAPLFPLEFKRSHDEDILFYLKFPYLFYELYSQVPLKQYDQLAISQYLYLSQVLMFDHLMDGKLLLEPQIAFWTNSAYQRIVSILGNLFPADSPFWVYFEKCRVENVQALTLERVRHTYLVSDALRGEECRILEYGCAYARPYSKMRGLTTEVPKEPKVLVGEIRTPPWLHKNFTLASSILDVASLSSRQSYSRSL